MTRERRIAVLGAGAVGGYLGGKLSLTLPPHDVTLIARPRVAEAVRRSGLVLRESGGDSVANPKVSDDSEPLAPFDLVILAVRTNDVAATIPELQRLLGASGVCLAMQNGVGTEELLAAALGRERVLAGTLTVSAVMEEPGVILRTSTGGGVAIASMSASPVPAWIVEAHAATGLPTVTVDDYRSLRWSKLLLNMLGAATSAILDIDMDRLIANPALFRLEQIAFREAGRVMDAGGIRTIELPGYQVPAARLLMRLPRPLAQWTLGTRLVRARSGRSPGSRADMYRGRTEIDSYNGAIAAQAVRLGMAAPANAALAELAVDLAAHPEKRDTFRGNPQTLIDYAVARGVRLR